MEFRRAQTPWGVMADVYRVAWNEGLGAPFYGAQRPLNMMPTVL